MVDGRFRIMRPRDAARALLAAMFVLAAVPAGATAAGQVSASPASGAPGTTVALRGAGFPASRVVRMTMGGRHVPSLRASADGAFAAEVTVPRGARGTVALVSRSGRTRVVNTFFATRGSGARDVTEMASVRGARVRITPTTLTPGAKLGIQGRGFLRHRRLTI